MAMSRVNRQNLLAVALVINRSRDGPAFVFHWPPEVQPVSGSPELAEAEDILLERLSLHAKWDLGSQDPPAPHRLHDDHRVVAEPGSQAVSWERLAGFPTRDLASILTPARSYHKRLFQLSLDPLLCISYPIHVPENGKWKRPSSASKQPDDQTVPSETDPLPPADTPKDAPKDAPRRDEADDEKRSSMTMFNLVFILNPKKNDVKDLIDLLYTNIVKKINKAYKYSQQHSDFIWKESKRILAAKDKAREDSEQRSTPPTSPPTLRIC